MKRPGQRSLISYIKTLKRPIFTSYELAVLSRKSRSTITQSLNYLQKQGVVFKIYRGIWGESGGDISSYKVIPFLFPKNRAYVSFISALHLHGIIEQIPQIITLASTAHSRTIKTRVGTYEVHRIAPAFFEGFSWYRGKENFLIAESEKALVDSLYISVRKKKQYGYFPELQFPRSFSFTRARKWVKQINDARIRKAVQRKLAAIENAAEAF